MMCCYDRNIINKINEVREHIENGKVEEAETILSSLEKTVINFKNNSLFKKQIEIYRTQINNNNKINYITTDEKNKI